MKNKYQQGLFWSLAATACFTIATLVTKQGFIIAPNATPIAVAFWGWFGAMVLATGFIFIPSKKRTQLATQQFKQHYKFYGIMVLFGLASGGSWFLALSEMSGGIVSFLNQNVTLWAFALGAFFLAEKVSFRELLAMLVAIMGLGIISQLKGETSLVGIIATLTYGLSLALQSLYIKKHKAHYNTLALTFWRGWGLALVVLIAGLVTQQIQWFGWYFLTLVSVAQFFGMFLGRGFFIHAHKFLPIGPLNLLNLLVPVSVIL